jgi:hypothetical protein
MVFLAIGWMAVIAVMTAYLKYSEYRLMVAAYGTRRTAVAICGKSLRRETTMVV